MNEVNPEVSQTKYLLRTRVQIISRVFRFLKNSLKKRKNGNQCELETELQFPC